MYLENDKYQFTNIEIIVLFVTPGMQRRGTSRHLCIRVYIWLLFLREDLAVYFILFNYMSTNTSKNISKTTLRMESI